MARYAQLVATGLPSGVQVTVKQNGVQVPNLFPSANALAPDNRPRTADSAGALFPATYVPNGTYTVAWSGGSTSVVVSGATGLPANIPFDMATQTELDASESDAAGTYRTLTGPDSFTIDSQDASGNVTQVTEHFGSTTVVTVYTWNADGSIATERATVNGVQGALKTYAYSSGVLTGAA